MPPDLAPEHSTQGIEEEAEEEDEEAEDAAWADLVEVLMVGLRMRVGLELAVLKASHGEAAVARALR